MAKKEEAKQATAAAVEEAPSTELEKVETGGAVSESLADLFSQDAGEGIAKGAGAYAIPFITILQKGSPQVSKQNAKYIKGAEVGSIMNTVTGDIYPGMAEDDEPGGILFVPCGYQKQCVRWKSRDSGGGLVAHYAENDPILRTFEKNERGQMVDKASGDLIIDTAYHLGLVLHETGFPEFACISMASTQMKKSRQWNTIMRRIMKKDKSGRIFNPPSYSHVYRLTTIGETKDSYDWAGWLIVSEGDVQDVELYKMAREFAKQIDAGEVRVSAPVQEFDSEVPDKEEVPF
jgi:hypothetical protein